MADPVIVESKFRRKVTLSSGVSVDPGDLIYHDGTNHALADADDATKYAQLVALEYGDAGDEIDAAPYAVIYDEDAPYTLGELLYLSGTAGAHTGTRPTGVKDIRQVVGRAHTTEYAEIDLKTSEVTVPWVVKGATSAFAQLDSGDFGGPTLDAQNEVALLQQEVPENAISVVKSVLRLAAEASAGTPTADITVTGHGGDDTAWDAITADATLVDQATEGTTAADDPITELDLTTGLDATDIIHPGHSLGMRVKKDDAGTDVIHILGGYTVYKVAG